MPRGVAYLMIGAVAGAALAGASHGVLKAATASATTGVPLFAEVFDKVRSSYAEKPDDDKLVRGAIDGMLASLDPHSTYFDPKALQDFQTSMKGEEFGGLGLEVMMEDGLVKVVSPIDDTPAARAGLLSGDLITRIDDDAGQGPDPEGSRRQDARPGEIERPASRAARRQQGRQGIHDRPRDHPRPVGALAPRERGHRLHSHHPVQSGSLRRPPQGLRSFPQRSRRRPGSRATSSTCATIPADCSTRRSRSPTPSSTAARSSRRAAATPNSSRLTARGPA